MHILLRTSAMAVLASLLFLLLNVVGFKQHQG